MSPSTKKVQSGFTLIELLVVVAIIALLTVIGFAMYTNAGIRSRDARRKLDLRNISHALEIYYQSNKRYPRTASGQYNLSSAGNWISDNGSPALIPPQTQVILDTTYIDSMPLDPKSDGGNPITQSGAGNTLGYAYWAGSISCTGWPASSNTDGGQYYILGATLENQSDADNNTNKSYKNCTGAAITTNNNAFIITSPQ